MWKFFLKEPPFCLPSLLFRPHLLLSHPPIPSSKATTFPPPLFAKMADHTALPYPTPCFTQLAKTKKKKDREEKKRTRRVGNIHRVYQHTGPPS